MFLDQTKIIVEAGKGGDGAVSFLREKYRPHGGPDGGDGGNGGNIIIRAKRDIVTLSELDRKGHFKAESGEKGSKNLKKGKGGEDLVLYVPEGTIIREGKSVLAELLKEAEEIMLVKGGNGGWGNWHFKTSIKQSPEWANDGLEGEKKELDFELKLIADVGIVGIPNAGKSTLLSVVSNAKPKIADYPFTTIMPNLGVVRIRNEEYIFADIPGLIEGAHLGKGLGTQFLRHIERTRILVHLIAADSPDYLADYQIIRDELESFSDNLVKKPEIIAINKIEIVSPELLKKNLAKLKRKVKGREIFQISAATNQNIELLLDKIVRSL